VSEPLDPRAQRIARNEVAANQYNERRRQSLEGLPDLPAPVFVCECGDAECRAPLEISASEYTSAHASVDRFCVKPQHAYPQYERIVERHPRYWVVEKLMPVEELVEEG
jgi:hypothetical protein